MKLMLSFLRRPAAMASLLLATAAPGTGYSADQFAAGQSLAPVGTRIQQVNFNSCPNGNCYNGGGWGGGWGSRWGSHCNGGCPACTGGGLFGCGCHHGLASGYAFVRPPAVRPLARVPNTYNYYWSARLAGVQTAAAKPGLQYPMVYQPTDTSQMGFYYQAVPRWYYRPEMLPAAPAPYWPLGMNGGSGGYYGGGWTTGTTVDGTVTAPGTMSPVTPVPEQAPSVVAPPPPADPQVVVPPPSEAYFPNRTRR